MVLIILVILIALIFEFINGFHDTAISIATVVSTKVLTPRQAVLLAAAMDLVGALVGSAVAKTIASGLVEMSVVSSRVLICALLGAIVWNLITWWLGLPSSSSHALIGSLCGAALAASHGDWGDYLVGAGTGPLVAWERNPLEGDPADGALAIVWIGAGILFYGIFVSDVAQALHRQG